MLKRIISYLLIIVVLIGLLPPIEVAAANEGPPALMNPDIDPVKNGDMDYVGYCDDVISCSSGLKIRWEDVDAKSYNVAVKVLDGKPAPGDNEPGKFLYTYTTGFTKTYISLSSTDMKSAAGKWIKVFVQAVFKNTSYGCHYYFQVEELPEGEPPVLTNPDIYPIKKGDTDYVGYCDDVISYSSSLRIRWEDVDADSYNVAVKILDGEPAPGDNEPGVFLYDYTTGYTKTYISLSSADMESAAGKWIKVFVQSVYGKITYPCHYYFKVEAKAETLDLDKTSVNWDWGRSNEDVVRISGVNSYSFSVNYNVPSSIVDTEYNYAWLNCVKSGNSLILAPNRANYADEARTAVITVTAGNESKTITVTQAACAESAPTIKLHRGSTSYTDGDDIGTFVLPQEVMELDTTSTNVCKVAADLFSSKGEVLAKCFTTSKISFDISDLPAGRYTIKIYATNSDTENDYWKQSPFADGSMTIYFQLRDITVAGPKDFASFNDAQKMFSLAFSKDWSEVGKINGVIQYLSGASDCMYYYTDDNAKNDKHYPRTEGYWYNQADANGSCTRAAASMAWSYMGITIFPKHITSRSIPYLTDADNLGCDAIKKNSPGLRDFNSMYDRYANDTTGQYSPVIIYTNYDSVAGTHAIVVFGRDVENGYYYVADSGRSTGLGKIKLVEVKNQIRISEFIKTDGKSSSQYSDKYEMICIWQYSKKEAENLPNLPGDELVLSQNTVNMKWNADNRATVQISGVDSYSFSVNYNVPSSIVDTEYNYAWLNCVKSGNSLILTPNRANYAAEARTAVVTVTAGNESKTITVTQAACAESAPVIKLFRDTEELVDGSSLGSFQNRDELLRIAIDSTNVRKVEAYLLDFDDNTLEECSDINSINFDVSNLSAGAYRIVVYASNSDTRNDYWKQSPFSDGSVILNFEVIAEHIHEYSSIITKPTCIEDGYTTYTCSCGDSYISDKTEKMGHTGGTATCIDRAVCSICQKSYGELNPKNHVGGTKIKNDKEATCTANGYTGDTYCLDCDKVILEGNEITALEHDMGQWETTKAATCTEDGTNRSDCSRCDYFATEKILALGHDHKTMITEATCTEKGYTTHTCHCGDRYVDSYKDALGHTGGTATCFAQAVCIRCDESYGELNPDNHTGGTEIRNAKVATCMKDGYSGDVYCLGCGEVIAAGEKVTSSGHNYKAVVTEPTCTEKGYTTYTCGCGDSYVGEQLSALGHSWNDATCTTAKTCSICHATEGNANGHSWQDATCISAKTCPVCKTTEGNAKGHNWSDATCTTPKTCSICHVTEGNAKGHSWIDATCTEPKTCSVCKMIEGEANGHNWSDATCTAPKTCSVCKATEGAANGHKWSDATCTTPKTCSVCKMIEGEANGHNWSDATCTDAKTCSVCKATDGDAKGHYWNNSSCTEPKTCAVCNATEGNAKGHSWSEATCTTPKTCEICGITDGTTIPHVFDQEKANSKYLVSDGVYYKSCKCGEAGTEIFTVKEEKPEVKPVEFKDVPQNAYYYNPVMWAVQNKITSGTGDGTTFEPNAVCTRGQVVTFLWRAAGQPEPKSADNPFKDVKTTDYFYKAVLWALENKITTGTGDGTTFEPHANCNRGQIVTFLSRAKGGKATTDVNPFKDVASNAYYYNPVLWAVENGITTGTGDGTTFEPNADCTRGQVITFLYRAYTK